jgi:hypothetical protein
MAEEEENSLCDKKLPYISMKGHSMIGSYVIGLMSTH